MRVWTAHFRQHGRPVLVREGFSLAAAVLGPIWLAANWAWVPAGFALAAGLAIGIFTDGGVRVVLLLALAWLTGILGRDLLRWQLRLTGYRLALVVAARDADGALARLLADRPQLAGAFLPAEKA